MRKDRKCCIAIELISHLMTKEWLHQHVYNLTLLFTPHACACADFFLNINVLPVVKLEWATQTYFLDDCNKTR